MRRLPLALFLVSGCIDNSGESLSLTNSIALQAPSCVADPAGTLFRSSGVRDITSVSLSTYGYHYTARIANNMQPAAAGTLAFGNRSNVLVDVNDFTIDGFNVCYEFLGVRDTTDPVVRPPPNQAPSCRDLGLKTNFFPAPSTAVTPGGFAAVSVDLFPPEVTGVNNEPMPSPPLPLSVAEFSEYAMMGRVPPNETAEEFISAKYQKDFQTYLDDVKVVVARISGSPFVSGLEVFGQRKTVTVHIQPVGRTRDQRRIEGNEFIYAVELCNGCLVSSCLIDPASLCITAQDESGKCK